MNERKRIIYNDFLALLVLTLSILTFLSLVSFNINDSLLFSTNPVKPVKNITGLAGAYWASLLLFAFGRAAYFFCVIFFLAGWYKLINKNRSDALFTLSGLLVLMFTVSILASISINEKSNYILIKNGGIIGLFFKTLLKQYIGLAGIYILSISLIMFSLMLLLNFSLSSIVSFVKDLSSGFAKITEFFRILFKPERVEIEKENRPPMIKKVLFGGNGEQIEEEEQPEPSPPLEVNISSPDKEKIVLLGTPPLQQGKKLPAPKKQAADTPDRESKHYEIPPDEMLSLTSDPDDKNLKKLVYETAQKLEETLKEFEISAKVVDIHIGPVITRFELQPAPGVKVNRIVSLADNIALSLAAQRVRIVAPIPGKAAVGVEIPNLKRKMVSLGDIIRMEDFRKNYRLIEVPLGKDISGNLVKINIKDCPHLLIAGSTGSGKSVLLNSIICSLIYNTTPDRLRFIMIDPKMVELKIYNGLPHLLTEVITNPKHTIVILKYMVEEMEKRYDMLVSVGARDIDRYNEKVRRSRDSEYQELPHIIIIIDEFADLMMVVPRDLEELIVRLAQKARAVGIHLVIATQRPSVDVITGIIKANFPTRIAFQVASRIDSRTILDTMGAEKLLGKGDMLVLLGNRPGLIRVQGAYISEEEVEKIINHINNYNLLLDYLDINDLIKEVSEESERENIENEYDEMYSKAKQTVKETKKASASYLQRRLKIGFNRAARYIDMMAEEGLISQPNGSKPRDVYIEKF
ncbi:MAG: DNA translocase FtsK [bacterium]|nr:DNA translocase FtsK [bacterium]